MGWAHCGTDDLGREIGYGVAATCDYPNCGAEIDRGLGYVCGPMHGCCEWGCGLYYCDSHRDQIVHHCDGELYPDHDRDESPCPAGQHVWTGQQMGGPPDAAESAEWVAFCKKCGVEKIDDD